MVGFLRGLEIASFPWAPLLLTDGVGWLVNFVDRGTRPGVTVPLR